MAGDPVYLFAHATGFHARCWDAVIEPLCGALAERGERARIIAFDARGHGRSSNDGPLHWERFGNDLVALIEALDLKKIVGTGHSMGGHCMVRAAGTVTDRFDRLVLADPVIMAPEAYESDYPSGRDSMRFNSMEEHPVSRRRGQFASVQEMVDRFATCHPYSRWESRVLREYG